MFNPKIAVATVAVIALGMTVQVAAAKKFNLNDFKGDFALRLASTRVTPKVAGDTAGVRVTIMRIGLISSDGKGNVTGLSTSTTDNGAETVIIQYHWTGTYTMNADGTGTLTMNAPTTADLVSCRKGDGTVLTGCETLVSAENYSFVLSGDKKSKTLTLIQVDEASGEGRALLAGTAITQTPKSGGGGGGGFPLF